MAIDHAALVTALKEPSLYPHRVEQVEYVQTHISSLFLTGDRVYKLKKPVNFGFLDFSTLELRERNCRAELELNRRLAPDVYLGVIPVTVDGDRVQLNGSGEIVDWLVEMQQLDQRLLGVRMLERGELAEPHVDQLVEILVPFYQRARTGEGVDEFGTIEAVKFNTDENFAQTEAFVGKLITRERFNHIRDWTDGVYEERRDLFQRRVKEGRIRESHGDLHLDNIFFQDPPVIFDCIEFSDRLRCGDIAVDLAFLAMDLDFRGSPDLSGYLIDRYVKASGDLELLDLLDVYKCYRAYVRGKICAFTAGDPAVGDDQRRLQRNLARHYFGLAYRYAGGGGSPSLAVLHGLMGTGKTSIARYLRDELGWHLISTDSVRKQISGIGEDTRVYVPYNEGLYSPEMSRWTYEEVCRRAENLLEAGFSVAVDGAFKKQRDRTPVIDLARRTGAKLIFIQTTCEPSTQTQRLQKRSLHDTRSDGRVELMEQQRADFEPPNPEAAALFVDIATDGPKPETRQRVNELLESHGLLTTEELSVLD
jgi:aminoglycoside phosphotransferase family enzyme/predicted kinase